MSILPLFALPALIIQILISITIESVHAMAMTKEPLVLISGGGPSGLLASILLNNIGVSSIVLERAKEPDEWSSKSYTIVLGDKGKSSLEKGGCLESAMDASIARKFVYFYDGKTGSLKTIPKKSAGLGFTRPLLVERLEKVALDCPRVTVKRGAGVSSISKDDAMGTLEAHLEDGSTLSATHVIGADGKWSKVRQSIPSLKGQARMTTVPAFGVHMNSPTAPKGFKTDGTYVVNPPKECMFYVIASAHPSGGYSITMVCYDETVERYPWLAPPVDLKPGEYGKGGWQDEVSALPENMKAEQTLSSNLQQMFLEEMPSFYETLDEEIFSTACVNRRATWLHMAAGGGKEVAYSTESGTVALIGDAAHAMTASMGEGCNTALESAEKLVGCVSSAMEKRGESSCSVETLSEGFAQYGISRPKEVIPIQVMSAARNVMKKKIGEE